MRRFVTARVVKMAVAFSETTLWRLKARKTAVGHLWSMRRFVTARVVKMAVAFSETTLWRLLAKI